MKQFTNFFKNPNHTTKGFETILSLSLCYIASSIVNGRTE